MTMPTVAVVTTNLDAGTDSPATARTDLLDAVQKLNQIIAHISTFAGTLLDDTTAAAARGTLGSTTVGDAVFVAATAAAARTALVAAASGANGDITSLTSLTTAISGAALGNKIQPISASVASNALTITLSPTTLDFRSATLTSGAVNTRQVASAISLVISNGSTLGTISAQQSRIAVLAIDNAGTVELAAVNVAGGVDLSETGIVNTTAEGGAGAADLATVIYSTTVRTGVPYRVVGYVESTQATAGTWATAPSTVQGYGGQALAAMSSLGHGQTWQNVTRNTGQTYYNTTGKPIVLSITLNATSNANVTVNGVAIWGSSYGDNTGQVAVTGSVVIPPGASYVFTLGGSVRAVTELR